MKKFRWLWVLGVSAAVFFGTLGTIDLSGQEKEPNWKAPVPDLSDMAKARVNNWVGKTNQKLKDLIITLINLDEQSIRDNFDELIEPFSDTYLRFPILEVDSKQKALGWIEVIWELDAIADKFVDVGQSEIASIPSRGKKGPHTMDYRLDITTELILNPPNNPGLRGCGLHRTSCYPDECQ